MEKTLLFKTNYFMNLKTLLLFALCFFMNNQTASSQVRSVNVEPMKLSRDICIYKPAPNPVKSFIPVSAATKERMTRDTEGSCSTFNVTYTGFTAQAQTAFQYAVNIWANTLTSTVPIEIDANFGPLPAGVLGGAGPYTFIGLTGGGLPETTWFPIALANSLLASDEDPGNPDIVATFSSTYGDFYFGTDGNPGIGEIDFVTVVLHEIGHGLGIVGFGGEELDMDDNPTGLGEIRFSGFASIWDHYIENGSGSDILSFVDPSVALLNQFEGGDLFSNGSETTSQNGGINPETYAPNPFQSGSSYSHWDEATYPAGNANSLMTPFVAPGEAIHDPGVVTLGFMNDMFWTVCNDLLSTQDIKKDSLFAYYPNPVNDEIIFEAKNIIQKITVYDILGQRIMQSTPKSIDGKMDLSELKSGVYLIQVSIENTIKTVRIVKN
ncbi:MAG: hypothetical protein ACI83H_001931 [Glaciecola sp.]|jgi:hypothetical protein